MGTRRPLRYRGVSKARVDSWQPFMNRAWRVFRKAFPWILLLAFALRRLLGAF